MTKEELISKSEVEKILKKYHRYSKAIEEIESLHTFSPEAIIEEEIEKLKNTQFLAMIDKKIVEKNRLKDSAFNSWIWEFIDIEIGALQELRSDVEKMEDNIVSKTHALGFAYWYHNWLTNGERWPVEEEFEKYMNETI